MPKITCPFHNDTNPSLELYPDGYYCFVCHSSGPLHELGDRIENEPIVVKPKINIKEKLAYIATLPSKDYRGHFLPYDEKGVYLVWPDKEYYKLRMFEPIGKLKYVNPTGHEVPLFWANKGGKPILFVVEGELNALSMVKAFPTMGICSPGAATKFSTIGINDLTEFASYSNVILMVDADGAGIQAAAELKARLLFHTPYIYLMFMNPDANELHVNYGIKSLQEKVIKYLQQKL